MSNDRRSDATSAGVLTYSQGGFTAAELEIDLAVATASAQSSGDPDLGERAERLLSAITWPNGATRVTTPEFAQAADALGQRCDELFG